MLLTIITKTSPYFFFYFENGTRASGRCIKRGKIRFSKTRIAYYSNSVATQALLLSGDVAKNPGTGQEKATNTKTITSSSKTTPVKCDLCEKTIRRNQKNILGVVSDAFTGNVLTGNQWSLIVR